MSMDLVNEIIAEEIKEVETIRKYRKLKEPKTTKICTICKIEKPLESMVINETLGFNRPVKMKNKCLLCYQKVSKDYYKENKKKVLESIKKKYEENKKLYSVNIKFTNAQELTDEYNKLLDKLYNNLMKEVKTRTYKKKKGGEGGSPANTSVSN